MATSQPAVPPPINASGAVGPIGGQPPASIPPAGPLGPPSNNTSGNMPNGYINGDGAIPQQQGPQGAPPPSNGGPPPSNPYGPYAGAPYQGGYPAAAQKPMMPPGGPNTGGYPGGPRFPSGQSISQQGGPTPTLNSLLQNRGGSNGPQQTGPPGGPPGGPPVTGAHRMPPVSSQGPPGHPSGPYGPQPPSGQYPGQWGSPSDGSNYYRHPQVN